MNFVPIYEKIYIDDDTYNKIKTYFQNINNDDTVDSEAYEKVKAN